MSAIYFRDDDLGWDWPNFMRLTELFAEQKQKLNAAAIPALCAQSEGATDLRPWQNCLQVVAHGFAHEAHQAIPKKSEYPAFRQDDEVAHEFRQARQILSEAFGSQFFAAFVPPWNRIDDRYLDLLRASGFALLSRSGLPRMGELNVNIDLHTLKTGPRRDAQDILHTIQTYLQTGQDAVIMLHHARMENKDFSVLEEVLFQLPQTSAFFSEAVQP